MEIEKTVYAIQNEEEKKYYYSHYKIEELNDKIQVLEELIEEREEK